MRLIDTLLEALPSGIVAADCSAISSMRLSAEEQELIGLNYSVRRRREFVLGRLCAKSCLTQLGHSPSPILRDKIGVPIWPDGVVGSISHAGHYCIAVAANAVEFRSIGVDIEYVEEVQSNIWPFLFSDKELAYLLSRRSAIERQNMAAAMFTAKEAFYKCQFPITRSWMDFKDVETSIDGYNIRFVTSPSATASFLSEFTGRSIPAGECVLTVVTVLREAKSPRVRDHDEPNLL